MQKNNSIALKNVFRSALNYRKPIQQINEFKNRPSDPGGNVNRKQLANHSFSTLPLGIGDTLVIFKTEEGDGLVLEGAVQDAARDYHQE